MPVVVIPGMLGSRLVNAAGEPVWHDIRSFQARFLELEYPQSATGGVLKPAGLMVTDFFLGDLEGGNYRGLLDLLGSAGFRTDEDLFVFAYDWRQSNFETARQLAAFIDGQEKLRGKRFNILAHSMGGLVATIYAHKHADASRVRQVITLATPYWGSLDALRAVLYGPRDIYSNLFARLLAIRRSDVNRVILSFPALYELMPSYDECCTFGAGAAAAQKISILDVDNWLRLGWLPAEFTEETRLARLRSYMAAAQELKLLVQQPLPKGIRLHRIAGDLFETNVRVAVTGYLEDYVWDREPGDDTVWWPSALGGYAGFRVPAAEPHNTIFDDPVVREAILNLLREADGAVPVAAAPGPRMAVAGPGDRVPLASIDLSLGPAYKPAGSEFTVEMQLLGEDSHPVEGVDLVGVLLDRGRTRAVGKFRYDPSGLYLATFRTPDETAVYEVRVTVPGVGEVQGVFAAIGEPP